MRKSTEQRVNSDGSTTGTSVGCDSSRPVSHSPLWLSHHRSNQAERCIHLAGRHICRRCAVLYPTIVATTGISLWAGAKGPAGLTTALTVSLLLMPFLIDWVAEHLGSLTYSSVRQVAVTVPAGIGSGLALAIHIRSPLDPWVTTPIVICACFATATALLTNRSGQDYPASLSEDWEQQFEAEEIQRTERLREMLQQ